MEYWAAQCAKLVDREAEAATTVDAATGKVIRAEPDTKLAADIRYAFEMLGWYSEKCAPYFHPKVKPVELGGTIDLRRLSYDDLQILVPLLRKARALTIEDRSESSTDVSADGSTEDNGGDRQQQAGGGRSSRR